jgi:uncharacterized protein YbjT (DUF2867 family)
MTILITGATGNVGKAALEALQANGVSARAASRSTGFDFTDEGTYDDALRGITKALLITHTAQDQVQMVERFVRKARAAGVQHIVRISVLGADHHDMPFARWHREAENIIKESGIQYTFLRPNGFMQTFLGPLGDPVKRFNTLYQPTADAKVSFIDARDVGMVAAHILTTDGHENKIYTLTGPQALASTEIAEILSKVTGKNVQYVDPGEDKAREGLRLAPMPDWLVEAVMQLFRFFKDGNGNLTTNTVFELTKRRPRSFLQFAAEHKDHWS